MFLKINGNRIFFNVANKGVVAGPNSDWICPLSQSEIMKEKIPDSEMAVFQGGHHHLFRDENDKFIKVVNDFIRRKIQTGV